MWQQKAQQGPVRPKLTIILDCCHSGLELQSLRDMEADGRLQGLQIAVYAAAAGDKLSYGWGLTSLMKNESVHRARSKILKEQMPCMAATAAHSSAVFQAISFSKQDLEPLVVGPPAQPNTNTCC